MAVYGQLLWPSVKTKHMVLTWQRTDVTNHANISKLLSKLSMISDMANRSAEIKAVDRELAWAKINELMTERRSVDFRISGWMCRLDCAVHIWIWVNMAGVIPSTELWSAYYVIVDVEDHCSLSGWEQTLLTVKKESDDRLVWREAGRR